MNARRLNRILIALNLLLTAGVIVVLVALLRYRPPARTIRRPRLPVSGQTSGTGPHLGTVAQYKAIYTGKSALLSADRVPKPPPEPDWKTLKLAQRPWKLGNAWQAKIDVLTNPLNRRSWKPLIVEVGSTFQIALEKRRGSRQTAKITVAVTGIDGKSIVLTYYSGQSRRITVAR